MALRNSDKDRELEEFMGNSTCVSLCPQSHQQSLSGLIIVTKLKKIKINWVNFKHFIGCIQWLMNWSASDLENQKELRGVETRKLHQEKRGLVVQSYFLLGDDKDLSGRLPN